MLPLFLLLFLFPRKKIKCMQRSLLYWHQTGKQGWPRRVVGCFIFYSCISLFHQEFALSCCPLLSSSGMYSYTYSDVSAFSCRPISSAVPHLPFPILFFCISRVMRFPPRPLSWPFHWHALPHSLSLSQRCVFGEAARTHKGPPLLPPPPSFIPR